MENPNRIRLPILTNRRGGILLTIIGVLMCVGFAFALPGSVFYDRDNSNIGALVAFWIGCSLLIIMGILIIIMVIIKGIEDKRAMLYTTHV